MNPKKMCSPLILTILGLDWHAWFTVLLILSVFAILLKTDYPTDIVFFGGIVLLVVTGTLPTGKVLSAFSSESVVVVALLFIVVAGIVYSGTLKWIVDHVLGTPKSYKSAIVKLMFPVAGLSAFMSNTTIVAIFINVVRIWVKKLKIEPSKLYIPLSYAAGMGGVCTLIGTPPNLIISKFYSDQTGHSLSLFTPLLPGLCCLVIGVLSVIVLSRLLPERKRKQESQAQGDENIIYDLTLPSNSHLVGQSFSECGLDEHISFQADDTDKRPFILSLVRFDRAVIQPVEPDEFLMGGDHIVLRGSAEHILHICRKFGLRNSIYGIDITPEAGRKAVLSALIMLSMITVSFVFADRFSVLECCFAAAFLMLICRCCSVRQAKQSIDWDVLVIFAGSICFGYAIEQTGLAELMANGILKVCGTKPIVSLIAICITGTFITEFISNTAAGAIFAPIAFSTATQLGVNPVTFCVALMISVGSSFATPIGSPTHMMVYGPGGYRFGDFLRIGIPMNFIILTANIFFTTLFFPLR